MLFIINHAKLEEASMIPDDPNHSKEGLEQIHRVKNLLHNLCVTSLLSKEEDVTLIVSGTVGRCIQIAEKMQLAFKNVPVYYEPRLGKDFSKFSQDPSYVAKAWDFMEEIDQMADSYKILCCRRQVLLALYRAQGLEPGEIKGGSIFEVDAERRTIRCVWSGKEGFWEPLPLPE